MALDSAPLLEELERDAHSGRGLDEAGAHALMLALLAGRLPVARTHAILGCFRERGPSVEETTGFVRALVTHAGRLVAPSDRPRPVVLPAYGATFRRPNLTALLALLLKRYGVCVLVHGRPATDAPGAADRDAADAGVTAAEVLRELAILPTASMADAQARLSRNDLAFVPVDVLAPGLARLLRDDIPPGGGLAPLLARLVDPFGGDGYRVVCAPASCALPAIREYLCATRADALLVEGAGGEPFPDPTGAPRFESFTAGVSSVVAEDALELSAVPLAATNVPAIAAWTLQVLSGERPMPAAILAELGACLAGAHRG